MVFGTHRARHVLTSVIYHWERQPDRKMSLRKLDHSAIYLLIAGTYTPFALVAMQGAWGWSLFGVVWTLAAFGIVAKTTVGFRYPSLVRVCTSGMGWLIVFAIKPLREVSPPADRLDRRAAACSTRAACRSTSGNRAATRTPCGTCSCSAASPATSSRC